MLWRCPMLIVKEFSWVYIYILLFIFSLFTFLSPICLRMYYFHNITGTMTMELGGKVSIVCSKTGYSCELEFKLRVSCIFGGEIREGVRGLHQYYRFCLLKLSLNGVCTQKPNFLNAQVPKYSSSQEPKIPSTQVPKFSSTQSPMYTSLQLPKFLNS